MRLDICHRHARNQLMRAFLRSPMIALLRSLRPAQFTLIISSRKNKELQKIKLRFQWRIINFLIFIAKNAYVYFFQWISISLCRYSLNGVVILFESIYPSRQCSPDTLIIAWDNDTASYTFPIVPRTLTGVFLSFFLLSHADCLGKR